MQDEINQRALERALTLRLTVVHGYASPTNTSVASMQASEFLAELRALADTKPLHFEQQRERILNHAKLIGLSRKRTEALITIYAQPR